LDELFSHNTIKAEGKDHLKQHFSSAVLFLLLTLIISFVASRILGIFFSTRGPALDWQSMTPQQTAIKVREMTFTIPNLLRKLVENLVRAAVALAGVCFYLNVTRSTEKITLINSLVYGFKHSFKAYFLNFLVAIVVSVGFVLLIIPGIIWGIQYMFAFYVLADHPDYSVMQAFRRSAELTQDKKMDLFKFILSFFPWLLLVAVTLGLGILYVGPYFSTSVAVYYNRLVFDAEGVLPEPPGEII
jgi:uncharacterized membrane protein